MKQKIFLDEPIVKWIDFGKTVKTESPLKHNIPWEPGSSEEGLLTGFINLIEIFSTLAEQAMIQPRTSNDCKITNSEKPMTSSDASVAKINQTQKKNFFIDFFKICSRTLSKSKI